MLVSPLPGLGVVGESALDPRVPLRSPWAKLCRPCGAGKRRHLELGCYLNCRPDGTRRMTLVVGLLSELASRWDSNQEMLFIFIRPIY